MKRPKPTARLVLVVMFVGLLFGAPAGAHHPFAPYDIRNPIEFSGVVESWRFMQPHPVLLLKEEGGEERAWRIEVATRQWRRQQIPTDAIADGDYLDVVVWPARDGSAEGVLSAFTKGGVYRLIQDEIRQRSAVEAAEAIEAAQD